MADSSLEFYFDFLSPYSYLAWFKIKSLVQKHHLHFIPRPVVLGALLNHWGHKGPAEIPPKRIFTFKDCLRKSEEAGVAFFPPPVHPFNPLPALRVVLPEISGLNQIKMIEVLWKTIWGQGKDGGDPKVLTEALESAGLPGEGMLAKTQAPEIKASLKKATEQAIAKGVWGVPTMTLGEELFWGYDQIPWIDQFLSGEDPVQNINVEAVDQRTHFGVKRNNL